MHKVKFEQWPLEISVSKGSLLKNALAQGIPIPNQCRSGECGSCRCRLLSGDVMHDDFDPAAMRTDERNDGWILACRTRVLSDLVVDCEGLLSSTSIDQYQARVIDKHFLTDEVVQLDIKLGNPLEAFRPGQFIDLSFDGQTWRSYSPYNDCQSDELGFYIKLHPGGVISQGLIEKVKINDVLTVRGPFGESYLREECQRPILAIASSTGLAPILSIARRHVALDRQTPFLLVFILSGPDQGFAEHHLKLLAQLNTHFYYQVLTRPAEHIPLPGNWASTDLIDFIDQLKFFSPQDARLYAAGGSNLVKRVLAWANHAGLSNDHLHCDEFVAAQSTPIANDNFLGKLMNFVGKS